MSLSSHLEGLIWILPWVFLQYEDSKFRINKLASWSTDYTRCGTGAKDAMLKNPAHETPTGSWRDEWPVVEALLVWLDTERLERGMASNRKSWWYTPKAERMILRTI